MVSDSGRSSRALCSQPAAGRRPIAWCVPGRLSSHQASDRRACNRLLQPSQKPVSAHQLRHASNQRSRVPPFRAPCAPAANAGFAMRSNNVTNYRQRVDLLGRIPLPRRAVLFKFSNGRLRALPRSTWLYVAAFVELHSRCFWFTACDATGISRYLSPLWRIECSKLGNRQIGRADTAADYASILIHRAHPVQEVLDPLWSEEKQGFEAIAVSSADPFTSPLPQAFNLRTGCTEVGRSDSQTVISNDRQSQSLPLSSPV